MATKKTTESATPPPTPCADDRCKACHPEPVTLAPQPDLCTFRPGVPEDMFLEPDPTIPEFEPPEKEKKKD